MTQNINIQSIAQRAETFRLSRAYGKSLRVLKQLEKQLGQDNPWLSAHQGAIYIELMDYEQAKTHLEKAIANSNDYMWAHAQLGETYRLLAIVNNRKQEYIDKAKENFNKAIASNPQESSYAWALAHLGATYRLEIKSQPLLSFQGNGELPDENAKLALHCLNRALELIPTSAWAWGMRATVYRLSKKFKKAFWDLCVETVIAQNLEVLQYSASPVPFLVSRRSSLHEHSLLSFYDGHYLRASAYAEKALILQPGDRIAKLIIFSIKAKQESEQDSILEETKKDIEQMLTEIKEVFSDPCKAVIRHQIETGLFYDNQNVQEAVEKLKEIKTNAGENHLLMKFVLNELINNPTLPEEDRADAQLWLGKNLALRDACCHVLYLLHDLAHLVPEIVGAEEPYRALSIGVNAFYFQERLINSPVLKSEQRQNIFQKCFCT